MTLKYLLSKKSIDGINEGFIKSYNHEHWWYKLKTHDAVIDCTEEFIDSIGDEFQDGSIEDYRLTLNSEVVFTYFHISEALFSLIVCRAADIPWLYMKHPRFGEICDFVREELVEEATKRNIAATFYPQTKEHEW